MNEHAGAASALSVLIVGLFAILLHDRHPTAPNSTLAKPAKVIEKVATLAPAESPRPQIESLVKPSKPEVAPPQAAKPAPVPTPQPTPSKSLVTPMPEAPISPIVPQKTSIPPKATTPAARPVPMAPKSAFTVVVAGEKLEDVAIRVYGRADAAESLWRANRDQVGLIDATLPTGTLLRTP